MDIGLSQKVQYRQSTSVGVLAPVAPARWGAVPPAEYEKKYPPLKTVDSNNFFKHVFGNGEHTHSAPLLTRTSLTTFPGVFSFDDLPLRFLRELASELDKELPVSIDKDSFSKTGIHTDFQRIKCPAGFFADPMSYVAVDNSPYREELGLTNSFSSEDDDIARELWHLVWSHAKVTSVNVAKLSTGGMRRFTHDVQWKLAYAEWLLLPKNFERMLNMVDGEDSIGLANEFETVYAMYLQKRGQVDSPDKVRMVIDREYAISSGKKGTQRATDKRVIMKDGRVYDDFSAIRARVVQAGPWTVNCFLQIPASTALHGIFERFPKTFHVNTADEIKSVVDGKHVFCSDVTEYDRSMPAHYIDIAHEVMAEYWDERIVKASLRMFRAPYYSKPLSIAGGKGSWIGDPTDWSFNLSAGNRSGHALTSLIGKVEKVRESLCVINKVYKVKGQVKKFLEGKGMMGIVDNGDDEIIWSHTKPDLDKFKKHRDDMKANTYVVKPEVGQGFSGLLLCRNDENDLYYRPTPKVHTTFEKLWVPERSIANLHRKYWTVGVIDRVSNITSTDCGRAAWDIHMSVYRRMMAPIYGDFMSVVMREHSKLSIDIASLTFKEKQVLDDPNKLYYKYSPTDVSSSVLDLVTSKIPPSQVELVMRKYFKGNLL